jgi:hypothetical protein
MSKVRRAHAHGRGSRGSSSANASAGVFIELVNYAGIFDKGDAAAVSMAPDVRDDELGEVGSSSSASEPSAPVSSTADAPSPALLAEPPEYVHAWAGAGGRGCVP